MSLTGFLTRTFPNLAIFALATAILLSCNDERSVAGGGGSDVPNDLSGTILSSSGEPSAGTRVLLRSANATPSRPGPVWETTSNPRGEFHLPLLPDTGVWMVEWRDSATESGAVRLLRSEWLAAQRIPPVRLSKWGALRGTIHATSTDTTSRATVVIPGLLLSSKVDSNGFWRIEDIPEGKYQPLVEGIAGSPALKTDSVTIVAAKETLLAPVAVIKKADSRVWKGILRSWDGHPVAGARLWLVSRDGRDSVRSNSVSDDSGRMAWILPDTGRGVVRISTATAGWTGSVDFADTSSLRAHPLPDTIVMQTLATLSGFLIPGAGPQAPVLTGYSVRIGSISRVAKVGPDGKWSFDNLPLGSWKLTIEDSLGRIVDSMGASAATFGFPTIGPMVLGPAPELGWSYLTCADAQGNASGRCLARTFPDSAWRSFNQAQRTSLLVSDFSWETTADALGRFAVARQSRQGMHLTALSADRRLGAFLALPTQGSSPSLPELDTVRNLKVALELPASAPSEWSMVGFRLVLVGTGRYSAVVHNTEQATFDSLAPGTYRMIAVPVTTDSPLPVQWSLTIGKTDLDTVVKPVFSQLEDSTQWNTSGTITLEVPAGLGDWQDIPVRAVFENVLDPSRSAAAAADFRVFEPSGNASRFWVADWDSATGRAEVWILADSLRAGSSRTWTWRQGNPKGTRTRTHSPDSTFPAKDWVGLWDPTTGKSLLSAGNIMRGSFTPGKRRDLGIPILMNTREGLETAIPNATSDSGCTFLAVFRLDTLMLRGNMARISGPDYTRSWMVTDSATPLSNQRLVLGKRLSDTVLLQSMSTTPLLPNGLSQPMSVTFTPETTTLHDLKDRQSVGTPLARLATPAQPSSGQYLELGRFDTSLGFGGSVSFPRLSRTPLTPARLVLESFNLQDAPTWTRVQRLR